MKYTSVIYESSICKRIVFLVVLLYCLLTLQAQGTVFKNGIQQGVVKVKFDASMTTTLSQMQIKTKGKTLSTGISSFDKAASSIKAMKMERLIPECPNPALEEKHRKAGLHLWYVVEFDQNTDPHMAVQALKTVTGVKTAECEYFKTIAPSSITPYKQGIAPYAALPFNDPYLKDQWHYINTNQLNLKGDVKADANLAAAWKVTAGSSNVIVSVHDEGIDVNHEDLKANMWVNSGEIPDDGIDNDGNGYIDDVYGFNFVKLKGAIDPQSHGTHVAGTIAAVNNNGIGVSGVSGGTGKGDGAKIMALQIIGGATAGHIFRSYVYAADKGAVISQNSWGYQNANVFEQDVLDGIDYFVKTAGDYPGSPMKGGIVIFAAGNYGADDNFWPGIYDKCLSVSSIGPEWKKAPYSNYGKWVEISAPGGDQVTYSMAKAGVLSTLPGNQYGYMDGTSMACPHVSGIAALALASSKKQLTNTELWQRLLTSVTDIEKYNPNYLGKLGKGSIDAGLAVRNNGGIAPNQITDLKVKDIAQEFATLEWTVPEDKDDDIPTSFKVYYSTEEISSSNLSKAKVIEVINKKAKGEIVTVDIDKLLGLTKYYFAVVALDRWANASVLSNVINKTTNNGPTIDVNTGSADKNLSMAANTAQSAIVNKDFQLLNKSEGLLRWEHYFRNTGHTISPVSYSHAVSSAQPKGIGMANAETPFTLVRNTEVDTYAFSPIEKSYVNYTSFYIGDTDPNVTTSGAIKFIVTEDAGFNLTQIKASIKYTMGTGPIIIEVYDGGLSKDKLCRSDQYQPLNSWNTSHNIPLKEHAFFKKGSEFYVVVHVPQGNGYSLGIGEEKSAEYSTYCYYSANHGANWELLTNVGVSQNFAWDIKAVSQQPNITEFLKLDPVSGSVSGNSESTVSLQANASSLINGTYKANVVFKSNDSKNQEYRMPVTFEVTGHKPNLVYSKLVEFGSVFNHAEKTVDILLDNVGYGLIKDINASIDNPQFSVVAKPSQIDARSSAVIRVKFKPTALGNINGKLTITNGQYTYNISLFGVGASTSKIEVTPTTQTINNIAIGDILESSVTIKNTGSFPLKYFIPGFDNQGISKDWPEKYHTYGYAIRSNMSEISKTPLSYVFNDITTTGVDITNAFIDSHYKEVPMGFDFPYYGVIQNKIYITKNGFTTFDNTAQPYNQPKLKGDLKGYISLIGYPNAVSIAKGKVLYKNEGDHLIIQYNNVEYSSQYFTGQIILYANGNIRFYYKEVPATGYVAEASTILIEDINQNDGIMVRDRSSQFFLSNETAIGFDYPGPDIITSVENGSGIISPSESVVVKAKMNTESLSEGTTVRNINIINNDPLNSRVTSSTVLNITSGGVINYIVSTQDIDFGVIYHNFPYSKEFTIQNKGSKELTISSLIYDNSKFTISGNMSVAPGVNEIYKVTANTSAIKDLEDIVKIKFSNNTSKDISLKALVRSVPVSKTDLSPISTELNIGENKSFPFEIANQGGSDLEASIVGGQWFKFEEASNTSIAKYNYAVKEENNGQPSYNWLDITKTGNKLPYDPENITDKKLFWKEVELPFDFSYYGIAYNKIKVGYNNVIALGGDPEAMPFPAALLPIENEPNTSFIFPLWSVGGFDTYNHPNDAGMYYQKYDDKVVISWMYFLNYFGWGQSSQVILHKDGTIKFQYKLTDGTSEGTNTGIVGLQKAGGKDYISISNKKRLPHGKGLAYVIAPDNSHVIPANGKMQGNIILDALNIYGGEFNDSILIKTNDPVKPIQKKPLSVKVAGTAKVEVPTEITLEDTEIAFNEQSLSYNYVVKPLIIKNTGTAPFRITNARMESGGKYLTQLVYVPNFGGATWMPIENIWGGYPQQLLLPGASFNSYVRFAPEVAGTYDDVLILSSSEGDIKVKLKGFGYDSPILNVDATPINVSFNTLNEEFSKSIALDNKDGGYKLDYNVSIKYRRGLDVATEALAKHTTKVIDSTLIGLAKTPVMSKTLKTPLSNFNRTIQYVNKDAINNAIGNNGKSTTILATKFVADKTGFNLSDVGTYAQLDKGTTGIIKVEVKVGGSNINNALSVATGNIEFNCPPAEGGDLNKQAVLEEILTLDKPIQILPNEEFYVIYTYPLDIAYPQTIQYGGVENVAGRYWLLSDGNWVDLQDYFPSTGYVMYAAERQFKESGWVKILTPDSGTLQKGESSKVDVKLAAAYAERGDQSATIVIRSTAQNASVVEIPASIHLNEAPKFIDVPSSVTTAEKEISTIPVLVTDKENHTIELEVVNKPEFVTSAKNREDSITLSVAPDYGHTGNYTIALKATDQYNAVQEHVINIHVAKTNQAPKYDSDISVFAYNLGANPARIDINDLFSDPDGDKFTFTVRSQNPEVAEVYQSGSSFFMIEPKNAGTTKLSFVVTDEYNASVTQTIDLEVKSCTNPEGVIVQKWNYVLLVNNTNGNFVAYQWYKNGMPIVGANKAYYGEKDSELDFGAQYFVELTTTDGNIILTCPMTPVKKTVSLKAYPNPVKVGEPVKVEAELPDLENNPLTIKVVNMSGRVVKTIQSKNADNSIEMPNDPGMYLIRVTNNNIEETFSIIVK